MTEQKRFIAVIGGSDCTPEEAWLAEEVGRGLARNGAVLICGGLGGVMEAACKGASAEGGLTIGILPGGSRQAANPYVNIPVVTNLGEARNIIVVKSAEAIIAIGGAYGTLSELGHALRNGTPVMIGVTHTRKHIIAQAQGKCVKKLSIIPGMNARVAAVVSR